MTAEAARAPARDSSGQRPRQLGSITVTPAVGTPGTRFMIEFKARNELRGGVFYDVEATGPEPEMFGDCDNDTAIFRHARRGQLVRVRTPSRRTRRPNWCAGRYKGVVWLEDGRHRPGQERDKVVGEFNFEVAPPAG